MAAPRTRDRILDASLALFNRDGLAGVSTHLIAAELGISPGNLHYHFRTKEAIVTALFRRFESRLTTCIDALARSGALDDLWLALHLTFEAIDAYRFVYRDIGHLLTEYPMLGVQVQALTGRSLVSARSLMRRLCDGGVIRATVDDEEMLALQLVFSMACWFTFERIAPTGRTAHAGPALATYYTLTLLGPYVTERSRSYLDYLRFKYFR